MKELGLETDINSWFHGSFLPEWLEKANVGDQVTFQVEIIENYVKRKESGFGVYSVVDKEEEGSSSFSVAGVFPTFLVEGHAYKIEGVVKEYRGKKQINSFNARFIPPQTKSGIIQYLQSLHGLKQRAFDIYELYEGKSVEVLLNEPERVAEEVEGVGIRSAKKWQNELITIQGDSEVTLGLLNLGLKNNQVRKIVERYGSEALEKVQENPYILATEIEDYGFYKCDEIARITETDLKGRNRIQAAILHVMDEIMREGHCYATIEQLMKALERVLPVYMKNKEVEKMAKDFQEENVSALIFKVGKHRFSVERAIIYHEQRKKGYRESKDFYRKPNSYSSIQLLKISSEQILEVIEEMTFSGFITREDEHVYLNNIYNAENNVARKLAALSRYERAHEADVSHALAQYLDQNEIDLEERQRLAVESFTKSRSGVHILNGAAGCGKTFVLNVILDVMTVVMGKHLSIALLAPTGRAAKVAALSTGRSAQTIHRALAHMESDYFYDDEDDDGLLDADVVVIDEFSMVDIVLLDKLLHGVKESCKVIFIGDHKQLPSIGPGRVLKDLLDVDMIDYVTLNVLKRQDAESGIALNADRILNGLLPITQENTKDAFVLDVKNVEDMQKLLMASMNRFLSLGYDWENSQILVPMRRGEAGINALNHLMQTIFNPIQQEDLTFLNKKIKRLDTYRQTKEVELRFKEGDKVMHTRNNYDLSRYKKDATGGWERIKKSLGVMNGEIGIIDLIEVGRSDSNEKENRIWVRYEDEYVCYINVFSELDHAYTVTIHKSQGSQWDATILLLMNQHSRMLESEMFYTGYSRAKKFQVTIGEHRAIYRAVHTHTSKARNTSLKDRLLKYS